MPRRFLRQAFQPLDMAPAPKVLPPSVYLQWPPRWLLSRRRQQQRRRQTEPKLRILLQALHQFIIFVVLLAIPPTPTLADSVRPYYQSIDYDRGNFGSWPHQQYHCSSFYGPLLNYVEHNERCDDGQYILISPRGEAVRNNSGPMIVDQYGSLVWTIPHGQTYNLNMYEFKGEKYLTFWSGDDSKGHGYGSYYMFDSSYRPAYKVDAVNGKSGDLHEFHITRDQTAVFTIYELQSADLSSVGGRSEGWILDGTFQEIDIETGELLFEWRASEHFDFSESYNLLMGYGRVRTAPWDFFHINSVDKDAQGNFLISSRHFSCVAYIDGRSGEVIWKLGGKENMFTDLSSALATTLSEQHHARFRDNDKAITLFDNRSRGVDQPSRGLYIDLDTTNMTAKVRYEYWNTQAIRSESQGSMQILDSGNVLLGYGYEAAWTEFTSDGKPLCEVHFGPRMGFGAGQIISYRAFKHPWVGRPLQDPDLCFEGNNAYVSWNGATEVVTWVLESAETVDASESDMTFVSAVPKDGFETELTVPANVPHDFVRVRGLDVTGVTLGSTSLMKWAVTSSNAADEQGADSSAPLPSQQQKQPDQQSVKLKDMSINTFLMGFSSATGLGFCAWLCYSLLAVWRRTRRRKNAEEKQRWVLDDLAVIHEDEREEFSDSEERQGQDSSLLPK